MVTAHCCDGGQLVLCCNLPILRPFSCTANIQDAFRNDRIANLLYINFTDIIDNMVVFYCLIQIRQNENIKITILENYIQ